MLRAKEEEQQQQQHQQQQLQQHQLQHQQQQQQGRTFSYPPHHHPHHAELPMGDRRMSASSSLPGMAAAPPASAGQAQLGARKPATASLVKSESGSLTNGHAHAAPNGYSNQPAQVGTCSIKPLAPCPGAVALHLPGIPSHDRSLSPAWYLSFLTRWCNRCGRVDPVQACNFKQISIQSALHGLANAAHDQRMHLEFAA